MVQAEKWSNPCLTKTGQASNLAKVAAKAALSSQMLVLTGSLLAVIV